MAQNVSTVWLLIKGCTAAKFSHVLWRSPAPADSFPSLLFLPIPSLSGKAASTHVKFSSRTMPDHFLPRPFLLALTHLFSADTTSLRGGLWFTEHTIPLIISEIILCLPSADLESDRSKLFFLILKYRFLYSTVRFFEPCTNQIWWQLMIYSRVLENFCPLTVDAKTGTGNY